MKEKAEAQSSRMETSIRRRSQHWPVHHSLGSAPGTVGHEVLHYRGRSTCVGVPRIFSGVETARASASSAVRYWRDKGVARTFELHLNGIPDFQLLTQLII